MEILEKCFFEVIENFEKIEVKAVLTNEKFLEDSEKESEENFKNKKLRF